MSDASTSSRSTAAPSNQGKLSVTYPAPIATRPPSAITTYAAAPAVAGIAPPGQPLFHDAAALGLPPETHGATSPKAFAAVFASTVALLGLMVVGSLAGTHPDDLKAELAASTARPIEAQQALGTAPGPRPPPVVLAAIAEPLMPIAPEMATDASPDELPALSADAAPLPAPEPSFPSPPTAETMLTPAALPAPALLLPETAAEPTLGEPLKFTRVIAAGETLAGILSGWGIGEASIAQVTSVLRTHLDTAVVRPRDTLTVDLSSASEPDASRRIDHLRLTLSGDRAIDLAAERDGSLTATLIHGAIREQQVLITGKVKNSLYQAASAEGLPVSLVSKLIDIFSYDVDFERDIRQGDSFEVMFASRTDAEGEPRTAGPIRYAALTLSGKTTAYYLYQDNRGTSGYYTLEGLSNKKSLIRTPIEGSKVSSGFGMRRHPILGYTRMHQGIDFPAPTGTPIIAAGDGVVAQARSVGGYGRHVQITHDGGYTTLYAHLSAYAKGIKPGLRVRQGDVIGFAGASGTATGPHLHFEVHRNGIAINPVAVQGRVGNTLKGKTLEAFKRERVRIEEQLALATRAPGLRKLAQAPGSAAPSAPRPERAVQ